MSAKSEVQELSEALGLHIGGEYFLRNSTPHPDWREHYMDVVPRALAERLAEALAVFSYPRGCEESVPYCKRGEEACRWCAARDVLAEFRAVFPKAEEA